MVKTFNYKKNDKESATLREVFVTAENDQYLRGLDLSKMRSDNLDADDVLAKLNETFGADYVPSNEVTFATKSMKEAKAKALADAGVKDSKVNKEWQKYFRTFSKSKFVKG